MINYITDFLIMGAVMSVIIMLMTALGKPMKRLSSTCRYILWSLVIIRLCIPFGGYLMPDIISIPLQTESVSVAEEASQINISVPDPVYSQSKTVSNVFGDKQESSGKTEAKNEVHETASSPKEEKSGFEYKKEYTAYIVLSVWAAGAVTFVFCNMYKYFKNTKILNSTLKEADGEIKDIYFKVCKGNGIKRIPPLYISKVSKTPMVYGFVKPKVILPDIELRKEDIYGILQHETVHYIRRDLYIKFIAMLANAIHWFNPLVYLACKKLFCEMELSCDERVLRKASKEQRISYGATMLEIVKKCRRSAPSLTTGFNPKRKAVKERFENILDTEKKKKGYPLVILVLCACIICTSIIGIGAEEVSPKPSIEPKNAGFEVLLNYRGDIDDIQPLYDIMDNSMDALGVSVLQSGEEKFIIDYDGEIRTELPESEYEFMYCSVCNSITDHLNTVDPESLELNEIGWGHGGGSGHYIYDAENDIIFKTSLGEYILCDDVNFAVVSEAHLTEPEEIADAEEGEGDSGHFEYTDDGYIFVRDRYFYREGSYYTETGKFGIVCNGELSVECEYDGYLDYDNYGICALKKNGKWGYYNHKGEMILDHHYDAAKSHIISDHAQNVPYSSSGGFIALNKDGKWGYADTEGNIVIDFIFEEARPVSMGKAWVKDSQGWKIISIKNVNNVFSNAEAAELINAYLTDYYFADPVPVWKLEYLNEKEFCGIPCYSFKVYLNGGAAGVAYAKEMIVTFDKTVYEHHMIDEYEEIG